MSSSKKLLVAAIDIRTTQSGWAFSTIYHYRRDPLNITYSQWAWDSVISSRIQTCILFNKDKVFDSFGHEAEDKYSNLAMEEKHHEWYFFKNFKTTLFNNKEQLSKEVTIYTEDGREMTAIDVFSAAIKFLRDHLLRTFETQWAQIMGTDIQWVITVPAISDDAGKQFMREAAEKADICGDNLLIVTDPEAVFLYYMHKENRDGREICSSIGAGTKYMVVIAENAVFEIAVYDVQNKRILKELFSVDWDRNKVDASLCTLLTDIVGEDVMEAYLSTYKYNFHELLYYLESKMGLIYTEKTDRITLNAPYLLLQTYFEMNPGSNINTRISSLPKYKNKLTWKGDRIRINAKLAKALFDESCSKIVYHMQELFLYPTLRDVSSILLAGKYAESEVLQFALREAFQYPHREVFTPTLYEMTGLGGAVLYGHQHLQLKD